VGRYSNNLYRLNLKEDIGELEEMEHLTYPNYQYMAI